MGSETNTIEKIMYNHDEIVAKTKILADTLNKKYEGKEVVLISVLSGALPFTLELIKHLTFDVFMDYISSSSYKFDTKISEPQIKYEAKIPLTGKHVIIVDEIIDTGSTMAKIASVIQGYKPESVSIASLIVKPSRIKTEFDEHYCIEQNTDEFLIGFGLDWNEKYRNLPYIASVKKEK